MLGRSYIMRRSLTLLVASAAILVVGASTALADYPPKGVNTPPEVAPLVVKAPSGLAFTGGGTVLPLIAVAVVLVLAGAGLMALARRLRTSTVD
jgi:hypothetical protein